MVVVYEKRVKLLSHPWYEQPVRGADARTTYTVKMQLQSQGSKNSPLRHSVSLSLDSISGEFRGKILNIPTCSDAMIGYPPTFVNTRVLQSRSQSSTFLTYHIGTSSSCTGWEEDFIFQAALEIDTIGIIADNSRHAVTIRCRYSLHCVPQATTIQASRTSS